MDEYIQEIEKNIATVNMYNSICNKISNYKHNNIYTTEIHTILKVHAGQCMYKHLYYKNIDDDAFHNIINIINNLCSNYNIDYEILCKIFNLLGYYSNYDKKGTIDYILECIFVLDNNYKDCINYNLLHDPELKLFLNFYNDLSNASYDELIDILCYYFYQTDLRDSFIQAYGVRLIEKMRADHKYFIEYYNIRYLNHIIQHLSNMLLLNVVTLSDSYNYIYDHYYDLSPDVIDYFTFINLEYDYCNNNNISYSDYVIDYYNNTLISLK